MQKILELLHTNSKPFQLSDSLNNETYSNYFLDITNSSPDKTVYVCHVLGAILKNIVSSPPNLFFSSFNKNRPTERKIRKMLGFWRDWREFCRGEKIAQSSGSEENKGDFDEIFRNISNIWPLSVGMFLFLEWISMTKKGRNIFLILKNVRETFYLYFYFDVKSMKKSEKW